MSLTIHCDFSFAIIHMYSDTVYRRLYFSDAFLCTLGGRFEFNMVAWPPLFKCHPLAKW